MFSDLTWLNLLILVACVWATGAILFRSYPAMVLDSYLSAKGGAILDRLKRMAWELQNGCQFDARYAQNRAQNPRPSELSGNELAWRKRQIPRLARKLKAIDVLKYFLGCPLCHHFWSSLAAVLIWRLCPAAVTLIGCVGLATVLHAALLDPKVRDTVKRGCSGGNCGKKAGSPLGAKDGKK